MATAILVWGLPGTGKTTFCRELVRRTGVHHFDGDTFAKNHQHVWDKYDREDPEQSEKARHEYLTEKARKFVESFADHDVVITEGLFSEKVDREFFYDILKDKTVLWVSITCSENTAKSRILADKDHVIDSISDRMPGRMKIYDRGAAKADLLEMPSIVINTDNPIDWDDVLKELNLGSL